MTPEMIGRLLSVDFTIDEMQLECLPVTDDPATPDIKGFVPVLRVRSQCSINGSLYRELVPVKED
jgi:hypothetical protein